MSKKLAVGSDLILLDVKAGSGAFMKTVDDALALAEACLELARSDGRSSGVAVTDMSQPLGDAIGNALDVVEAVEILRGSASGRLRDLVVWFAARAAEALQGIAFEDAKARAARAIDGGDAAERFRAMIEAQGGDPRVVDDPGGVLPRAPVILPLTADRSGTLAAVRAEDLGLASGALGAGRMRKGDPVDPAVGIVFHPKIGDVLAAGDEMGEIHARSDADAEAATARVHAAIDLVDGEVGPPPLVYAWLEDRPA
jgi:pyrimidine-nucleoside phosphorylase